jgi:cyclomaltodextrinase / maltogenic alpha-amylase / neopullulanase
MQTPNWIQEANFYHIYPLGLCGAPYENNAAEPVVNRLGNIHQWIPHLKSIGFNAIYIGPLFESMSHGYDTTDYCLVDRRLGTNEDLKHLVDQFHQNGIHVIFDAVFNHVGRDFPQFIDLQKNGQNSPYKDWFTGIDFSKQSPLGDPFDYLTWEGHYSLVKLNLDHPDVSQFMLNNVRFWFETWQIDGLRLDAIDQVSLNFLKQLHTLVEEINPQAWLMGESVHSDYRIWANPEMVHSITNYECYKGLYSSHNDQNLFEIAYAFNRQSGEQGIYKDLFLYNFADNHDCNRIASMVQKQEYLRTIYTLLYTMPGVPSVYYGSEFGIKGTKTETCDRDLRPALELSTMQAHTPRPELPDTLRQLFSIRQAHNALKLGNYQEQYIQNKQFAFSRQYENETILVAINIDEQPCQITVNTPVVAPCWVDLLNPAQKFQGDNSSVSMDIPAFSGRILQAYF